MFRSYLKTELEQRLQLTTHVEPREYDIFVLRAGPAPRLQASPRRPSIWVRDDGMELVGASLADLASVLQGVFEKPIVDETDISGTYNMQIGWGADRTATLTAELRDRFGLELMGYRRTMDTLIVDDIRPETSLVLLGHIGRAAARAPAPVRQQLARLLAVH